MVMPKKGLQESQFKFLTAGQALQEGGSHQIYKVHFIENGVQKLGFYKKLDVKGHYPELLAKISVAVSIMLRMFMGKKCAEERLVFNEKEEILGTLSIAIEGWTQPLNFATEPVPDAELKELVIPSTKTLLEVNAMETVIAHWFIYNDDLHPHNLGIATQEMAVFEKQMATALVKQMASFDYDMGIYWFTIHMKEPRPIIGIPNTSINLTVGDFERNPVIKDAKHYHCPGYDNPGQESLPIPGSSFLPKQYAAPKEFQQLGREPLAQEQKLAAVLKILLTYNPAMLRARFEDGFGNLALNYTSLEATNDKLRSTYEKNYPELCNAQTDKEPFVDFLMKIFQLHYDNLYRVVVFYAGCKNNGHGLPLPATHRALAEKPSYYRRIEAWIRDQNKTLLAHDRAETKYNEVELERRYHQIWRDAFAPSLRDLLRDSHKLANNLLLAGSKVKKVPVYNLKDALDKELTASWQYFSNIPTLNQEAMLAKFAVDAEHKLRVALPLVIEFSNKLYDHTKTYYQKDSKTLKPEDNTQFIKALESLLNDYEMSIRANLDFTSSHAKEFNLIYSGLKAITDNAYFLRHLTRTDEQVQESSALVVQQDLIHHTDPSVVNEYIHALFNWAKNSTAATFEAAILRIINKYESNPLYSLSRQRGPLVRAYLESSKHEPGNHRLAYILSSSSSDAESALNRSLIKRLTPIVLKDGQYIACIDKAIKDKTYEVGVFVDKAVEIAKKGYTHLFSPAGEKLFHATLFAWVDKLSNKDFKAIIESTLKTYEKSLSFFSLSRRGEVETTCAKDGSKMKALALIFMVGEIKSNSYNTTLFNRLIATIQEHCKKTPELLQEPGYALITQYDPQYHERHYMEQLKSYSTPYSHIQKSQSSAKDEKKVMSH